ncbi:hypothetical protein ABW20_dc0104363 [Dactylellina cionopaga]|nr:hypothetical protein ABW20_dc0104363 [Dactylellina cionopaga]
MILDGVPALVRIRDTIGQEFGRPNCPNWSSEMNETQAFMLVYSITSRRSFEYIPQIRQYFLDIRRVTSIPMTLVGNKCDLECDRQVSYEEGFLLAEQFGCDFMEASAKTAQNVDEAFHALIREITLHEKYKDKRARAAARIREASSQNEPKLKLRSNRCVML